MQLSNLKLIAILATGAVTGLAIGASTAHVAKDVGPDVIAAHSADEGTPPNLIVALKADEGVPHNLVTAMKFDEGIPHNLVTAMKADEGVPPEPGDGLILAGFADPIPAVNPVSLRRSISR